MIVKIAKTEVEPLKKICALADAKVRIFTVETNDKMVQVEITENDGRELKAADTWLICRSFCCELEIIELRAK